MSHRVMSRDLGGALVGRSAGGAGRGGSRRGEAGPSGRSGICCPHSSPPSLSWVRPRSRTAGLHCTVTALARQHRICAQLFVVYSALELTAISMPFSGNNYGECGICLENKGDGDLITVLTKCQHSFHQTCLAGWFEYKRSCPFCRATVSDKGGLDHCRLAASLAMVKHFMAIEEGRKKRISFVKRRLEF